MTPLFQKIKEILHSSKKQRKRDLKDEKYHAESITRWEKEYADCLQQEIAKAELLTLKYSIVPNNFAIIEVPAVTHGNASMTAVMLILGSDDFARVIEGENIVTIEMIMAEPCVVFSYYVSRIFYARIGNLKIFTDTSFPQNSFFRNTVWRALLYEVQSIAGKQMDEKGFIDHLRDIGKIFFDPVSNENVINIFLEYGKNNFIGSAPVITCQNEQADA